MREDFRETSYGYYKNNKQSDILLVAPHGGNSDTNTELIAKYLAEELDCAAVINTTFERWKRVVPQKQSSNLWDCNLVPYDFHFNRYMPLSLSPKGAQLFYEHVRYCLLTPRKRVFNIHGISSIDEEDGLDIGTGILEGNRAGLKEYVKKLQRKVNKYDNSVKDLSYKKIRGEQTTKHDMMRPIAHNFEHFFGLNATFNKYYTGGYKGHLSQRMNEFSPDANIAQLEISTKLKTTEKLNRTNQKLLGIMYASL